MARILLITLLACSKTMSPGLDPGVEAKAVDALRHLAAIYAADANDCTKLAAELDAFSGEFTTALQAVKDAVPAGEKNPWDGKHADVLAELRAKSKPALEHCLSNRAVIMASQKLRLE